MIRTYGLIGSVADSRASGHLLLYFKDSTGIKVLLGEKQVISYESITNLKNNPRWRKGLPNLKSFIDKKYLPLETTGKCKVKPIGRRMEGSLLSNAGRCTFFGGGLDPKDSGQTWKAALREFNEEFFGLKDTQEFKIAESSFVDINLPTSWGGVFYAVNVSEVKDLKSAIDSKIKAENDKIRHFEDKVDVGSLYNSSSTYLPEMHSLEWMDLNDFVRKIQNKELVAKALDRELPKYCAFLSKVVGKNCAYLESHFKEHLLEYAEYSDSIKAANKLIALLSQK